MENSTKPTGGHPCDHSVNCSSTDFAGSQKPQSVLTEPHSGGIICADVREVRVNALTIMSSTPQIPSSFMPHPEASVTLESTTNEPKRVKQDLSLDQSIPDSASEHAQMRPSSASISTTSSLMEGTTIPQTNDDMQAPLQEMQSPTQAPSSVPQLLKGHNSSLNKQDDTDSEQGTKSRKKGVKSSRRIVKSSDDDDEDESTALSNKDDPNKPLFTEIPRLDASKMSAEELERVAISLPIVFVRGMTKDFNEEVFTMSHLAQHYGDRPVDVLMQDPDSFGFNVPANKRVDHTVGEYVKYAQELEKEVEESLGEIEQRVLRKMSGATATTKSLSLVPSSLCSDIHQDCSIGKLVGRAFLTELEMLYAQRMTGMTPSPMRGIRRSMIPVSSPAAAAPLPPNTATPAVPTTPTKTSGLSLLPSGITSSPGLPPLQERRYVKFCVNVDCGDWPTVVNELNKLPQWCKWGSPDKVLRHLPKSMTIPGLSLPQLYLKVPGVWTGGHEENSRFHSINTNHGPGVSIWGAIAPEHCARFRQIVLEEKGVDIYKIEGRWFPDPQFCAKHNIPMMVGVQRPGDTAILNGATLHWVRAGGFAVNSSWNFGVRLGDQIDLAFDRDRINQELRLRSIVPIRSLGVQILADIRKRYSEGRYAEADDVQELQFVQRFVDHLSAHAKREQWYLASLEQECEAREQCKKKSVSKLELLLEPKDSLVLVCDACYGEIVHYYVVCDSCAEENEKKGTSNDINRALPVFFCPPCGLEHGKSKRNHCMEGRYKFVEDSEETDFEEWLNDWKLFYDTDVLKKTPEVEINVPNHTDKVVSASSSLPSEPQLDFVVNGEVDPTVPEALLLAIEQ